MLKRVKQDVFIASEEKQLPSLEDNSIGGDFFFTPGTTATQPITQKIVKTEPVYVASVTTAFDYGYGTADAPTVTVGTQEWLGKNLNVDHFANGDPIPEAKTEEEWKRAGENKQPAWCYYNNDPANGPKYGRFYNWYAVNDPRGLAPKGWHVPSDSEWDIIIKHLAGNSAEVNKPVTAGNFTIYTTDAVGTLLKSTSGWNENGNGNNNSGIAGLPGGYRNTFGTFNDLGKSGYWWSSSEGNAHNAWSRYLDYGNGIVYRDFNYEGSGFSVRCLRD